MPTTSMYLYYNIKAPKMRKYCCGSKSFLKKFRTEHSLFLGEKICSRANANGETFMEKCFRNNAGALKYI